MAKLKTGRHTSALKAQRQSVKRNSANTGLKKVVRLAAKEVAKTKTAESVAKASSALDKAAKKGVIHWKSAARKKSRLAKSVNKAESK
ncbi:30S ribosomal protein S20 [Candidatus Proelusimicrobium volucris]|uniref:30S ribosomal protein S20 n=1 Tax=Candidatus Proelusimicrobium volucris TaxID=3416225 RepID=UPI003D1378BA